MYIQKIKVRCQSSQQILKNKEYFNLTDWGQTLACPFQNNRLSVPFTDVYLTLKLKVRYRASHEILKIKEYSIVIG